MEMLRERNEEVESHFYTSVKAVFGENAYAGTHPTGSRIRERRKPSRTA